MSYIHVDCEFAQNPCSNLCTSCIQTDRETLVTKKAIDRQNVKYSWNCWYANKCF